jgi:hypothetical protein
MDDDVLEIKQTEKCCSVMLSLIKGSPIKFTDRYTDGREGIGISFVF